MKTPNCTVADFLSIGRTEMHIARWILAGLLITFSTYVALGQWYCIYVIPRQKNAQGEPRNYSMVPLIGGGVGAIGCVIAPLEGLQRLWWLPLVLDPGCVLMFGAVAVFWLVRLLRGKPQ